MIRSKRRGAAADPHLPEWAAILRREVSSERLREDVRTLPAPRSRLHWPEAMREADAYLLHGFEAAGWRAERRPFELTNVDGYMDLGTLTNGEWGPTVYERLSGANIVATKDGAASSDTIVIGAHHDTIRDSPGADDNTASVAALLELARMLSDRRFRRSIQLVAFDMEELGMVGSAQFVRNLHEDRGLVLTIVFETMSYTADQPGSQTLPPGFGALFPRRARQIKARGSGDWAAIVYRRSSKGLARAFERALSLTKGGQASFRLRDPLDFPAIGPVLGRVVPAVRNFSRSDHVPFWQADQTAILIGDTANFRNPNYHQPTDTPDTLDYDHLAAIVAATALTILGYAGVATA